MTLLSAILSVLYPRLCAGCNEVLADEAPYVCEECLHQLALTEEAWHRGNRLEMLFRSYAPYKKNTAPADKFVRGAAYTYYHKTTPIRAIVRTCKFVGHAEVGQWMGKQAAEYMIDSGFFEGVDMLVPIPLHANRLRERGFNQSEWIARGISEVTGIPVDTSGNLWRAVDTEHQSLKTLEERAELGEVFALHDETYYLGKHVMLVDDVVTSGSTMGRVMQVLHPVRNCQYSVFTLSYAKSN